MAEENRYYLTGADWLMQALDLQAKEAGLNGNYSQVVLEIDSVHDECLLKDKLREFLQLHPMLTGETARGMNLCPYWRLKKNRAVLNFTSDLASDDAQAKIRLAGYLNEPLPEGVYLVFHVVHSEARSFFAMKFDHRLFDAMGAELFLMRFNQYYINAKLPPIATALGPDLNHWGSKFAAGRVVNRFFLALRRGVEPLTLRKAKSAKRVKFLTHNFSAFEFKSIEGKSEEVAGHMMMMPYLLAISSQSFYETFFSGKNGEVVVPVNIDMRDKEEKSIFFNHVSFLFFRLKTKELEDLKILMALLRQGWFEQVKNGIPKALHQASMLLRIAPLPIASKLIGRFWGGDLASFSFSCLNAGGYNDKNFFGAKVYNVFHLPIVPPSPGIGIFFTQHDGGLNLTISYLEGITDHAQIEQLAERIKDNLF